jgi:predicted nucleic acid-binding protein
VRNYVLDARASIAFFEDRPGADNVEGLLAKASEAEPPLLISMVDSGEVYSAVWLVHGEETANRKLDQIAQLPIEIIDADASLTRADASLKAQYNLPYADFFAAALVATRKAALVTRDMDSEYVTSGHKLAWL